MMFIYLDIIHYQIVGDTKAPLLRVIDTNRRVKNIQSIAVNLRTETGRLVPFAGGGKVVLTLKFQKFSD